MRSKQSGINYNKKILFPKMKSYITFLRMFQVLYKSIGIVLFFQVVITIFQITDTVFAKVIIDMIANVPVKYESILVFVFLIVLVNIISQVLDLKSQMHSIDLNYKLTSFLTHKIISKLKKVQLENLENPEIYNLLKRIDENLTEGGLSIVNGVMQLISLPFSIVMYSFVLGNIKWYFPIIVISMSVPYFFVIARKGMDEYYLNVQQSTNSRKLSYLYNLLTSRSAIKEIKMYNLAMYLMDMIRQIRDKLWKEKYALLLKHTIWLVFISILKYISLGICLLITCLEIHKGSYGIGNIVLAITAVKSILESMSGLLGIIGELNTNFYNLTDLEKFLSISEVKNGIQQKISSCDIEFEKVFFKYPQNRGYALCNINTCIRKGEKIALVGANGSGKSTFVHLLLGLYTSNEGCISIDGKKIEDVAVDLRKKTACVFQDFIRFQFSIKENILLDMSDCAENVKKVNEIDDAFFLSYKEKENTQIGQFDEDGVELSGGQWQRIAIYRALLRTDAELLILDEPTAKLDPCIESKIYEEFAELAEGKTVIFISHRLSAAKLCDKIFVFEKGMIVEEGSHDDLMKRKNKYYDMFMTQKGLYV